MSPLFYSQVGLDLNIALEFATNPDIRVAFDIAFDRHSGAEYRFRSGARDVWFRLRNRCALHRRGHHWRFFNRLFARLFRYRLIQYRHSKPPWLAPSRTLLKEL